MLILDMSSGNRAIWFDKSYAETVFVDLREVVKPDIVCNTCYMPFASNIFDLIVFDPPHVNFGCNSQMSKTYGYHTTDDIRRTIMLSSIEAARVSKPDTLMILKWNDHDQKLDKILKLMKPWYIPLFGHKVAQKLKHASSTQYVTLKRSNTYDILNRTYLKSL